MLFSAIVVVCQLRRVLGHRCRLLPRVSSSLLKAVRDETTVVGLSRALGHRGRPTSRISRLSGIVVSSVISHRIRVLQQWPTMNAIGQIGFHTNALGKTGATGAIVGRAQFRARAPRQRVGARASWSNLKARPRRQGQGQGQQQPHSQTGEPSGSQPCHQSKLKPGASVRATRPTSTRRRRSARAARILARAARATRTRGKTATLLSARAARTSARAARISARAAGTGGRGGKELSGSQPCHQIGSKPRAMTILTDGAIASWTDAESTLKGRMERSTATI